MHNALKLAKTYILGKATRFNGVELRDRQAVRKVSFLAELVKKNLATVSYNNITISFVGQKLQYPLHQLIYDNNYIKNLRNLYLCQSYGCECEDRGDVYMCEIEGSKYYVRKQYLDADMRYGPLAHRISEPYEFKIFKQVLKRVKEPLVVDVGAYIGAYSLAACALGARVVALEPDPENYQLLKANLELNNCTQAKALNMASGASKGSLLLLKGVSPTTHSLTPRHVDVVNEVKEVVKVDTLDNILHDVGFSDAKIGFMKIDVEGAEVEVLKGAEEALERTSYLQIEVFKDNVKEVIKNLKWFFQRDYINKISYTRRVSIL